MNNEKNMKRRDEKEEREPVLKQALFAGVATSAALPTGEAKT
jgi:hypothetical protein